MGFNIVDQIRLQGPSEEVELADRRDECFVTRHAELDAFSAAVCVKVLLVVGVELALVGLVNDEALTAIVVGGKVLTAVLGYKPVDDAKADFGLTGQVGHDFADVRIRCIETLETGYNELRLAVNLGGLPSLGIGGIGQGSLHWSTDRGESLGSSFWG